MCLDSWTFPVTSMVIDFNNEGLPVVVSTLNANELLEVDEIAEGFRIGDNVDETLDAFDDFPTSDNVREVLNSEARSFSANVPFAKGTSGEYNQHSTNDNLYLMYESLHSRGFQNPQELKYFDFLEFSLQTIGNKENSPKNRDEL